METDIENLKTTAISRRGGARVGAGRKPKLQHEARELFNAAIDARWPLIMQKLDGLIEEGDKDVLKFIVEQRIGKATHNIAVKETNTTNVNYSLFYRPKVREAVRVYEDVLKGEMIAAARNVSGQ